MKKLITAFVTVKEESIADFLSIVPNIVEKSNAEEGCVSYQLFQDPFNPIRFSFIEQWKDQSAIDFHFATPHFNEFGKQLQPLLASPLEIVVYDIASEQNV